MTEQQSQIPGAFPPPPPTSTQPATPAPPVAPAQQPQPAPPVAPPAQPAPPETFPPQPAPAVAPPAQPAPPVAPQVDNADVGSVMSDLDLSNVPDLVVLPEGTQAVLAIKSLKLGISKNNNVCFKVVLSVVGADAKPIFFSTMTLPKKSDDDDVKNSKRRQIKEFCERFAIPLDEMQAYIKEAISRMMLDPDDVPPMKSVHGKQTVRGVILGVDNYQGEQVNTIAAWL